MRDDERKAIDRVEALVPPRECPGHRHGEVCEVVKCNAERMAALVDEISDTVRRGDLSLAIRLMLTGGKVAEELLDQLLEEMDDPQEALRIMIEGQHPGAHVVFFNPNNN